jgi:ubiquinone biosynthesis protein
MWAFFRLLRATFLFGRIFLSYLWLRWMTRLRGAEKVAHLWAPAHKKNARRLYDGMVRLRGVFIKLGQVLSVMGNFLPKVYADELEKLQDQVPPQPYDVIEDAIVESLGKPPWQLFDSFDEDALAAASLGQVHRARLKTGEEVAVKILYPNIATIMAVDLQVMEWAVKVMRIWIPTHMLEAALVQLREMLSKETDYRHEARAMARMAENFAGHADILCPKTFPELSTDRVLTMTFMPGVKISKRQQLEHLGLDPYAVARLLVEAFYKQLFVDAFFHADPHPGNFLVQKGDSGPKIVILDYGAATECPPHLIDGMLMILRGVFGRDDNQVVAGIHTMGFVSPDGDQALLERTVRIYFQKLLALDIQDFGAIKPEVAAGMADTGMRREQLRELMKAIAYPEGWFYVERAVVILFGLSAQLAPRLNTVQVGFPYIMRLLATRPPAPATSASPARSRTTGVHKTVTGELAVPRRGSGVHVVSGGGGE